MLWTCQDSRTAADHMSNCLPCCRAMAPASRDSKYVLNRAREKCP